MQTAILVVLALSFVAIGASWLYFTHWRIARPPIGVFNGVDVAVMIGGILLVPYLYLALPQAAVLGLLALGTISILFALVEPVLRPSLLRWGVVLGVLAADWAAWTVWGAASPGYLAVNNAVILLTVVATTNLWAGSGMSARAAAVLGGVLLVYDFTATSLLPLMGELILHLAGLPLSPVVGWIAPDGSTALIGLGDLLLASVFPLVMRRSYGEVAGRLALGLNMAALTVIFVVPVEQIAPLLVGQGLFPVMAVLGPLMIAQYLLWAQRKGAERPTWQYWQALARTTG